MPKTIQTTKKRSRGRPKLPAGEGKRYPLSLRTTREIREVIEREAIMSGRSLAQEAEYRIQKSFADERAKYEDFGGMSLYWFMKTLAVGARATAERLGGTFEDSNVRPEAISAIERLLPVLTAHTHREEPKGTIASEVVQEVAEFLEARLLEGQANFSVVFQIGKRRTKRPKK